MNQVSFERGDLVYYEEYEIYDPVTDNIQYKGPRLIVILDSGDPYLVLISTSQKRHFPGANPNCNPKLKVFLIKGDRENAVQNDTYVKVDHINELSHDLVQSAFANHKLLRQAPLSEKCFELILDCLKQFRRDIVEEYRERIFNRSR